MDSGRGVDIGRGGEFNRADRGVGVPAGNEDPLNPGLPPRSEHVVRVAHESIGLKVGVQIDQANSRASSGHVAIFGDALPGCRSLRERFYVVVRLDLRAGGNPGERSARQATGIVREAGRPGAAPVYRLAGLILGNQHDAEDATQDALLRAWNAYSSLRSPEDFQAWFDRILVNVCRDRLRRRKVIRFLPMGDEDHQRPGADPFQQLIASDELLRAMDAMDADLRTCVVLRYWADLTVDEIARRTGWRAGTVKSRLHRAIELMRARISSPQGVVLR